MEGSISASDFLADYWGKGVPHAYILVVGLMARDNLCYRDLGRKMCYEFGAFPRRVARVKTGEVQFSQGDADQLAQIFSVDAELFRTEETT